METSKIVGREQLREWFGSDATFHFHDAEIIELQLKTGRPSHLSIHAWTLSGETDKHGIHLHDRDAVVTLVFDEVLELDLIGFSPQNVISRLDFDERADGVRVEIIPSYGLGGTIDVARVSVDIRPYQP